MKIRKIYSFATATFFGLLPHIVSASVFSCPNTQRGAFVGQTGAPVIYSDCAVTTPGIENAHLWLAGLGTIVVSEGSEAEKERKAAQEEETLARAAERREEIYRSLFLDENANDESTLVDGPQVRASAPESAEEASLQERIDSAKSRNDWGKVNLLLKEKFASK